MDKDKDVTLSRSKNIYYHRFSESRFLNFSDEEEREERSKSDRSSGRKKENRSKTRSISRDIRSVPNHRGTLGRNSRRGAQEVTSTGHRPRTTSFSLGGEERGIQSIQIGNTMTRRVFESSRGGGVLGHGKIHESRDYRLVLRPKCLQGNNGVSEIIRVTGEERWKLFSPQFPFVGARSHLGSLGFFEKRRERERGRFFDSLYSAIFLFFFLSRSDGGGGRSYFLLWSVFHFSETERDLSNKRGMLDLRDDP